MPLAPKHLEYFKELFEGRARVSWNAWFEANRQELEQSLPRAEFLRLRFKKLDEAERILKAHGIPFEITAKGKQEKRFSLYALEVCDEFGRPKAEFLRKAYDGAVGEFMDGRVEAARDRLVKYVKKIKRKPIEVRESEFADLCFDGEIEIQLGNADLGRILLEPLAAMKILDDRIDPMIFRARELLALGPPT